MKIEDPVPLIIKEKGRVNYWKILFFGIEFREKYNSSLSISLEPYFMGNLFIEKFLSNVITVGRYLNT